MIDQITENIQLVVVFILMSYSIFTDGLSFWFVTKNDGPLNRLWGGGHTLELLNKDVLQSLKTFNYLSLDLDWMKCHVLFVYAFPVYKGLKYFIILVYLY